MKLGYGGTRTEMERLLEDAEKLSGVEYDISNLSDVYNAIHVIQEDLGLTGVAAEEASTTLSGSFGAMKAAAENFMAYLTTGQDIQPALTQLIESTATFLFENLVPALGNVISALPEAVLTFIQEAVPQILESAKTFITEYLPNFLESGIDIVNSIIEGTNEAIPDLTAGASDLITSFIQTITDRLPDIIESGTELVVNIAIGLIQGIPQLVEAVPQLTDAIRNAFLQVDWAEVGKNIIKGIIKGLKDKHPLISAAADVAAQALDAAKDKLGIQSPSRVFRDEVGKMIDLGIAEGIKQNISSVTSAMNQLASTVTSQMDSIVGMTSMSSGGGLIEEGLSLLSGGSSIISQLSSAASAYRQIYEAINSMEETANLIIGSTNKIVQAIRENRASIRINDRDIVQAYSRGSNLMGQSLIGQGV